MGEAVIPTPIALSRATRDRRVVVALKTREPRRALPVVVALADAGLQVLSGPVVAPLQLDAGGRSGREGEEEEKEGGDERGEGEAGCHVRDGAKEERGGGEREGRLEREVWESEVGTGANRNTLQRELHEHGKLIG